jgi:hypothetical protein
VLQTGLQMNGDLSVQKQSAMSDDGALVGLSHHAET